MTKNNFLNRIEIGFISLFVGETPVKRDYTSKLNPVPSTPLEKLRQGFRARVYQNSPSSSGPNSPSPAEYSFLNE